MGTLVPPVERSRSHLGGWRTDLSSTRAAPKNTAQNLVFKAGLFTDSISFIGQNYGLGGLERARLFATGDEPLARSVWRYLDTLVLKRSPVRLDQY